MTTTITAFSTLRSNGFMSKLLKRKVSVNVQTVLVGIVLGLLTYHWSKKKYKLPPGPFSLPLIGNLLAFRNAVIFKKFTEWSKIYGPVITIYFGPVRCVVVNNADKALEALVKKSGDFAGRPFIYSVDKLSEGSKDIVAADYGPVWKFHRRLAGKALRQYLSGSKLERKVEEAVTKVTEMILREKGAFNPFRHLSLLMTNLLYGVCFGTSHDMDNEEFKDFMDHLDKFNDLCESGVFEDVFPPLRLCPTKRFRELLQVNDHLLKKIGEKYQEHKRTFDPENIRDYTDFLLLAKRDETEEKMMADVYFKLSINDIFRAGIDTSRQTLQWVLMYMSVLPDVQSRVQDELDAVLGGRFPRLSDRNQLSYTEATLHESMRMSPVVPLGVPHKTIKDTTLGDYDIPAGTMVMINQYSLHHDPKHWDHPDRFLPERFLDEDGKLAPKPESWMPFSAGRRNCLGETVAKPELFLIFAALMQKFRVSLEPGVIPDLTPSREGLANQPPMKKVLFIQRDGQE